MQLKFLGTNAPTSWEVNYQTIRPKATINRNTKTLVFNEEGENLSLFSKYKVIIYHGATKLEESPWLNTGWSKDSKPNLTYSFITDFENTETYIISLQCKYIDAYEREFIVTYEYEIVKGNDETETIGENSISAQASPDKGAIEVVCLKASGNETEIKRCIVSNSESFETVHIIENNHEIWEDTTIESGVFYKYKLGDNTTNPVMVLFEDMYLSNKDNILKIRYNPSINSIKYVINESITATLGSQYPFVRRNGNTKYRQFTIGGLISCLADEQDQFLTKEEAYGDQYGLLTTYEEQNQISNYTNEIYERKFRDKVIEFLHSGNIMLFRSTHEGNMLVYLTNIQLTPDPKLGRRIYSFSAQATEIAECTVENLKKYGFLKEE